MLNRRILRIKAFKAVYAYAENQGLSLKEVESQLELSCQACRDLYLFLLASIAPITEEARNRIDAARAKFNPSEAELHPNMKFALNSMPSFFDDDPDFHKLIAGKKFSWDQYDVLLRQLYESIRTKDWFEEYLNSPGHSLGEDALLWEHIFEEEFDDNAALESILEDLSIWWNDDLQYALSWCCRTMDEIASGKRWNLPPLYMSEIQNSASSDRAFVVNTVRRAVSNFERYVEQIASLTRKWDRNRICATDLSLIVCGVAEHETCPEIPVNVTINEYVEISKFYSTPESKSFVNGLLDKMINN